MKHLISLARAQAAAQVSAAQAEGTPSALAAATAQLEQLEIEIARMEKAVSLLRGYVDDVNVLKIRPETESILESEDMEPQYCLEVPVFEILLDDGGLVAELPNLVIGANDSAVLLAEIDAAA